MKLLLCTDLHFSDSPKDRYRFDFIEHISKQVGALKADAIVILGDLTDRKDNHSAILVNAIIAGLRVLRNQHPVYILKGNHDYLADPTLPFFKFLNHIEGINFVTEPTIHDGLFFIPHLTDVAQWKKLPAMADKPLKAAFIHQTVSGAVSESGQRLDGFPLKPMRRLHCPVYGGDIHKPQTIGPVIYIGPPYHIRFGDNFEPRYLIFDTVTAKHKTYHFDCPRKWMLNVRDPEEILKDERLREGDQVKVKLELTREEMPDWAVKKQVITDILRELKLDSFGVELKVQKQTTVKERGQRRGNAGARDPNEIVRNFSKREKVSTVVRDVGLELLKG
jgi:DNA repair exonuclease SbcCD nuclease subunit